MKICENCENQHSGEYASGRFCSNKCAKSFSSKNKRLEINAKVSATLKGRKMTSSQHASCINSWTDSRKKSHSSILRESYRKKTTDIEYLNSQLHRYTTTADRVSGQRFKHLLMSLNLIENRCSECKIGPVYNNKAIVLQLDHIDGHRENNSLDNVRVLCPNCHSQTDTFRWKNASRLRTLKKNNMRD